MGKRKVDRRSAASLYGIISFTDERRNLFRDNDAARAKGRLTFAVRSSSFRRRWMSSRVPVNAAGLRKTRVWDLPTRLFHWLLAFLVIALIVSAHIGGNAMEWHFRFGYAVLSLLAFRILWGFVGGYWSRFARFFYGPATAWRYFRGRSRPDEFHDVGHNPLGSFSVYALLIVLVVQVVSGLVSDDEIASSGPLVRFVSSGLSSKASAWHADVGQWLIIALAALHVLAVLFYVVVKHKQLIGPMISGDKTLPADVPPSLDGWPRRGLALVLFVACVALSVWIAGLRA
jgi:cytochrome b